MDYLVNNYIQAFTKPPFFEVDGVQKENTMTNELFLPTNVSKYTVLCLFWSTTFYWFWSVYSDFYHFSKRDLYRFPVDLEGLNIYKNEWDYWGLRIEDDLKQHAKLVEYKKASGVTRYYELKPRRSKHIFDEIDEVIGKYYGFTTEEVEFIKNFNIRFRDDDRNS